MMERMTLLANQLDVRFPSIARGEARVHRVRAVRASREALDGYGEIVADYAAHQVTIVPWPTRGRRRLHPGTGIEGGVTEGAFEMHAEGEILFARNDAVARSYIIGWYADPATARVHAPAADKRRIFTHEANYHPDGGQIWFPRGGQPFVALLAKPGDDVTPDDFVAFHFDGSFGLQIAPGVWHQPAAPVADRIVFDNKQGRVHACVDVDFLGEFGCYLEVPLGA
jgi:ureidoglycolate lyase/seryl-tRNA synthetase